MRTRDGLKIFLDSKVSAFNRPGFITDDPVSIPHRFSRLQDIEIAGLLAATLSWGQRVTIIHNCHALLERMDHAPFDFVTQHTDNDLRRMEDFVHRTFNGTDLLYFIDFFARHYRTHATLEELFTVPFASGGAREALSAFHEQFFDAAHAPGRTRKHVSTPVRGSACKRLNMFLRWMVRRDDAGVDFGCWKTISPAKLICPLDLHVERVARRYGLLKRKQTDWEAAEELTAALRRFDVEDPVKYDFALFGLGVAEKLGDG
ncbi:MAG: TIGR02757 family protein [Bacteroidota bacterium]